MSLRTKLFGFNERERKEIYEILAKAIQDAVVELDKDGRYVLVLPNTSNAEEVAATMVERLELPETNFRVVILTGENISLLRF